MVIQDASKLTQWRRHTRACHVKCTGRNTSALAVNSGNNKIKYQDILTALVDVTNDLSMPCHEQQTGVATELTVASPCRIWITNCSSPDDGINESRIYYLCMTLRVLTMTTTTIYYNKRGSIVTVWDVTSAFEPFRSSLLATMT